MKSFVLILSLFFISNLFSQNCPYIGPDITLPCGQTSTTLNADLSQCNPGLNPNATTNYQNTQIPYVAQTNTGTSLTMSDDSQQGPFNIGFTFCFYGNTYTQFYIGSNGWISFSPNQPTTYTSAGVPNASAPVNSVMAAWQDWHPGIGGQIRYQVQGTAPCRKLIVSWISVPFYSCTTVTGTFHIVLYESTNVIEVHIQNKQFCAWSNGTAVQTIQNSNGTQAVTTPGRNSTQWTAQNDGRRWTPSGTPVTPTPTWYQVGNPAPIATGLTVTVTPPPAGAYYTCRLEYPSCFQGWNSCNSQSGPGPDTIFVLPGNTGLLPAPDFWKVIPAVDVPLTVIAGGVSLKVCPALTSKIKGEINPHPPPSFNALMASVNDAKFVPPVGNVLLIVNKPPAEVIGELEGEEVNETLSTTPAGFNPPLVSLFQVKINRTVTLAAQLPITAGDKLIVAVCIVPAFQKRPTSIAGAAREFNPREVVEAVGVYVVGATDTINAS
jgi:hypothetical protein